MPIPEGYEKLAVIGIVNKGEYSEDGEYKQYNYVYYEGSTYLALRDNPEVPPTNNKTDWQYLAQGVVGAKGDKGEPGAKGDPGVSITSAEIVDGVLHVHLSDGNDVPAGSIAVTKQAVVDALGWVNLLTGTKDFTGNWINPWAIDSEKYMDFSVAYSTVAWNGIYQIVNVKKGETYTFSAWGYADSEIVVNMAYSVLDSNNAALTPIVDNNVLKTVTFKSEWKRYSHSFTVLDDGPIYLRFDPTQSGIKVKVCGYKLEPGANANPDWTPALEDVVTKTPEDAFAAFDSIPEMHRCLFRGKNLGESTAMSQAHKDAIKNGTFKDLWVGDYWTHGNIKYRIADMDYWYRCGNKDCTTHHLVIVPDVNLLNGNGSDTAAAMNDTNIVDDGYYGSKMYKTTIPTVIKPIVDEAFGETNILNHQEYLVNGVRDGHASSGGWFASTIELMNEIMVYGTNILTPMSNGSVQPTLYTIDNSQLALFRLNPCLIKTRQNYWLRDVASATGFALVGGYGYADWSYASDAWLGVRPVFGITG